MLCKKIIWVIVGLMLILNVSAQPCNGTQNFTLTPPPPAGGYSPGQVVTVNYTLNSYNGININWIHAFEIGLGPGWVNLTPITTPGNPLGSIGNWVWDTQHNFIGGLNFGPGWRFENTGNIDWGTSSSGPFTMSFQVTVSQTCLPEDLTITMQTYDDCVTGGWSNGNCCIDPPFNIYNGNVQVVIPTTSNINHY